MRVVHVNTYDCNGGAARSAFRLHQGLRRLGADSRMFVVHRDSDDPNVAVYVPPSDLVHRIARTYRRRIISSAMSRYRRTAPNAVSNFSDDRAAYGRDPWRKVPEHDLIQLHWVVKFLDYEDFFASMPAETPLVWTLHDMFPLTGGCHFNQGCPKFAGECGACPQLHSQSTSDVTRQIWHRKQQSLRNLKSNQLHIVTPSRWLQQEVQRSSLMSRFPCSVIPYGLDVDVFAPRDRRVSREILRIPPEARVVLFVADDIDNPRKGFRLLAEALVGLESYSDIFLLSVGSGSRPTFENFRQLHIDRLRNDGLLSCIYSAADILVAPSLEDNLPNTVLESIACGTPVAGFAVGGIPEAVRPSVSGLLASRGNVAELKNVILELLQNPERLLEMSANCRRIALQEYALEVQAGRYMDLYHSLLDQRSGLAAGRR